MRVRPTALRAAVLIAALGAALSASGCAETVKLAADAADPQARAAPVAYRPVLGPYRGARPVEPAPWPGAPKKEGAQ
jgi:hypothetical protein